MSKMDGLRALREARYESERAAAGASRKAAPKAPGSSAAKAPAASAPAADVAAVDEGLCGHRSMNGRTCTRERGHSAKSHRYS